MRRLDGFGWPQIDAVQPSEAGPAPPLARTHVFHLRDSPILNPMT